MNVAITVSPAPVTSVTWSLPEIGMSVGLCLPENATMPSRPRVMTRDCSFMREMICAPAEHSVPQSRIRVRSASSTSGSLGVAAVIPENSIIRWRESSTMGTEDLSRSAATISGLAAPYP